MVIRIAQIKISPQKGNLKANHTRLMSVLDDLQADRPDVVITPECFLDGYVSTENSVTKENIVEYAIDPTNSPYSRDVSWWAGQNRAWFILGCTTLASGGTHNSALIFNRVGRLVGVYHKVHYQGYDTKYLPGGSLPVFESDLGPFAVMICADRRWPETVRTLVLRGAQVIFNPTYGMHDERNLHMMQTRSYESEVFIAFTHPSVSLITGPEGEIICNEDSEVAPFVISKIDLSHVSRVRSSSRSHLKGRRPEVYSL